MKYICVLLALLVLTLSVQPICAPISANDPCCNVDRCDDRDEEQGTHDDSDDGCKSCNPFQLCGCCAFAAVVPQVLESFPSPQLYSSLPQWGISAFDLPEEPVSGILQPPQLV